jgi:dihydropteroate synthase
MAIVNITPDSFYTSCRTLSEEEILKYVDNAIAEGADILDIGACSTRPNSTPVAAKEEWDRLDLALQVIRHHWKDITISVDTFRADIAEKAIAHGADVINDVYGGEADPKIWEIAAKYHCPYILTHAISIPENTPVLSQLIDKLQQQLDKLHRMGVADVIVDPGFGFGKTLQQSYRILQQLNVLNCLKAPLLVGLSRKSMLYKPLNISPQAALPATIAAQTLALEQGAKILRVHDVAAAKQAIGIYNLTNQHK